MLQDVLTNYKECLVRLTRVMPQTGFLMHQLVCMLVYQEDRLRRALVVKEAAHLTLVHKLEEQLRQMKNQLLSSKEVSNQYQRLENEFRQLTERYTDRIENS
jgi:hypothetical protein